MKLVVVLKWPWGKAVLTRLLPNKFGSTSFQSKDVSGAQKSEFLLLLSRHSRRVSASLTFGWRGYIITIYNLPTGLNGTVQRLFNGRLDRSCYPPNPQVVSAGGQQVRVGSFSVGDPHDLGGGVGMVKSVPAHKLGALLLQADELDLKRHSDNSPWVSQRSVTHLIGGTVQTVSGVIHSP